MDPITLWSTATDATGWAFGLLPSTGFIGNRWVELTVIMGIVAGCLVLLMRVLGFPGRLRAVRRRMLGHALGVLLYRRQPRTVIHHQLRLLTSNGVYLLLLTPTLVFSGVLFGLLYPPLADRYAHAPAGLDRPLVVCLQWAGRGTKPTGQRVDLPPGLHPEARAWIPAKRTLWLRLRPKAKGVYAIKVGDGGHGHVPPLVLNAGVPSAPAVPRQTLGPVKATIDYPEPPLIYGVPGWTLYALIGLCLLAIPWARLVRLRL